jgi:hypothetical protein
LRGEILRWGKGEYIYEEGNNGITNGDIVVPGISARLYRIVERLWESGDQRIQLE